MGGGGKPWFLRPAPGLYTKHFSAQISTKDEDQTPLSLSNLQLCATVSLCAHKYLNKFKNEEKLVKYSEPCNHQTCHVTTLIQWMFLRFAFAGFWNWTDLTQINIIDKMIIPILIFQNVYHHNFEFWIANFVLQWIWNCFKQTSAFLFHLSWVQILSYPILSYTDCRIEPPRVLKSISFLALLKMSHYNSLWIPIVSSVHSWIG